jgi:hypothetical protein
MMIHEPAKWAGWQSTTAAAQHLDRLKQMQSQIYQILSERSGRPLRQIIRDTKRTDFYLDAQKAKEYGLIDEILGPADKALGVEDAAVLAGSGDQVAPAPPSPHPTELSPAAAASEPQPPPSDAIVNVLSGKRMSRKE